MQNDLNVIRCSCSHLLGYAIKNLWPISKIANCSSVRDGFYCDIDLEKKLVLKDLEKITGEMNTLIKNNWNLVEKKFKWEEVYQFFFNQSENYKIQILNRYTDRNKNIKLYGNQEYFDICDGNHVRDIKLCLNFKLLKISGAYWLDNSENKMLQRIYGTAWFSKRELCEYLLKVEKISKRDHRKIAKNLDLYFISEKSPGMIFWKKNGLFLLNQLKKFIQKRLEKYNYEEVLTPLIMHRSIWEKTGHWKNYKENIFTTFLEDKEYCIKPMNCPGHVQIFKNSLKSYRDLPLRIAEFGLCHRNESSGSLHGLMRLKSFIQDDAHIFCTKSQLLNEIRTCINLIFSIYRKFGFNKVLIKLSTRPKKKIGSNNQWDEAEKYLTQSLKNMEFDYQIGEGAFYGPKIEFILYDCLDRSWQCGTIQLDFSLSKRLGVYYIDKENNKKNPVIIHRAILGSLERFIGILIEHYNGHFPLWLAPLQVVIIKIADIDIKFIEKIVNKLRYSNIRTQSDLRKESIGLKIREYTLRKIPYILICGKKEVKFNQVSVRTSYGQNLGRLNIEDFIEKVLREIRAYYIH